MPQKSLAHNRNFMTICYTEYCNWKENGPSYFHTILENPGVLLIKGFKAKGYIKDRQDNNKLHRQEEELAKDKTLIPQIWGPNRESGFKRM